MNDHVSDNGAKIMEMTHHVLAAGRKAGLPPSAIETATAVAIGRLVAQEFETKTQSR